MIKIVSFTGEHINQALNIAKINYENERKHIDILPAINEFSDFDFTPFAKNKLGVVAFDEGKMVGYLCCFDPYKNAFDTTNDSGIWSPIYGNGIIECNCKNIFARMYQEAAGKWVGLGVTNHAITFYAHNYSIQNQLYRYGFGLRCIDAIRSMDEVDIKKAQFDFSELENAEFQLIYPLGLLLDDHLKSSPMFLCYEKHDGNGDKFAKREIQKGMRYFVAKDCDRIIAYIRVSDEGENFIGEVKYMKHIQGAYCLPEYRGQGVFQNLLNYLIKKLQNEKNQLLGVDFESFNPTASGFWLKYFTEYTQSVVRRVDDRYIN
jgi:GNAT superfamily N-acetyltransferase